MKRLKMWTVKNYKSLVNSKIKRKITPNFTIPEKFLTRGRKLLNDPKNITIPLPRPRQ